MESPPEAKKRKVEVSAEFEQYNLTTKDLIQQVAKMEHELIAATMQFEQRCHQGRTNRLSWTST